MKASVALERLQRSSEGATGWLKDVFPGLWVRSPSELAALSARATSTLTNVPRLGFVPASEAFHRAAGTFTPVVRESLRALSTGAPLVRLAHQPIMLPYMGVIGQFILLSSLRNALQALHDIDCVSIFQVVDYDVITERRLRVAYYPHISARSGFIALSTPRPERNREILHRAVAKPSPDHVAAWISMITAAVREDIAVLRRRFRLPADDNAIYERLREIRKDLMEAQEAATSHAEFTAFWLSRLINGRWHLPVAFVMASEALRGTAEHVRYLVDRYDEACDAAEIAAEQLRHAGFTIDETLLPQRAVAPMWYVCPVCQVRTQLRRASAVWRAGCALCGRVEEINAATSLQPYLDEGRLIPRVLFQDLLDIVAFRAIGGVGYIGNAAHMLLSSLVARSLALDPFPERLWRPRGIYYGAVELRAALEPAQIGAAAALDLVVNGRASGPYYVVSQGFEGLRDAWLGHLDTESGLKHPLHAEQPSDVPAAARDRLGAMI